MEFFLQLFGVFPTVYDDELSRVLALFNSKRIFIETCTSRSS